MAIILEHRVTKQNYMLLGTGYSAHWREMELPRGQLVIERGSAASVVTVCGEDGTLDHLLAVELRVVSIDGKRVETFFTSSSPYRGA